MSKIFEDTRCDVKTCRWFLVSGLFFIAVGITIFVWPSDAYVSLGILFSILMVSSGLSQVFFSIANIGELRGWGWILVSGIIDLTLGTYLLIHPIVTMATLPCFGGFWLIIRTFYIMGASLDLRSFNVEGWGWLLFGGIICLLLGCFIVYYPAVEVGAIIAVFASTFVLGGLMNIYLAYQLNDVVMQAGKVKNT